MLLYFEQTVSITNVSQDLFLRMRVNRGSTFEYKLLIQVLSTVQSPC